MTYDDHDASPVHRGGAFTTGHLTAHLVDGHGADPDELELHHGTLIARHNALHDPLGGVHAAWLAAGVPADRIHLDGETATSSSRLRVELPGRWALHLWAAPDDGVQRQEVPLHGTLSAPAGVLARLQLRTNPPGAEGLGSLLHAILTPAGPALLDAAAGLLDELAPRLARDAGRGDGSHRLQAAVDELRDTLHARQAEVLGERLAADQDRKGAPDA